MQTTALKLTETLEPNVANTVGESIIFRNRVIMQELVLAADWEVIFSEHHAVAADDLLTAARMICACEPEDAPANVREAFLEAYRGCVEAQSGTRPSDQMGRLIFRASAVLGMYFGVTD